MAPQSGQLDYQNDCPSSDIYNGGGVGHYASSCSSTAKTKNYRRSDSHHNGRERIGRLTPGSPKINAAFTRRGSSTDSVLTMTTTMATATTRPPPRDNSESLVRPRRPPRRIPLSSEEETLPLNPLHPHTISRGASRRLLRTSDKSVDKHRNIDQMNMPSPRRPSSPSQEEDEKQAPSLAAVRKRNQSRSTTRSSGGVGGGSIVRNDNYVARVSRETPTKSIADVPVSKHPTSSLTIHSGPKTRAYTATAASSSSGETRSRSVVSKTTPTKSTATTRTTKTHSSSSTRSEITRSRGGDDSQSEVNATSFTSSRLPSLNDLFLLRGDDATTSYLPPSIAHSSLSPGVGRTLKYSSNKTRVAAAEGDDGDNDPMTCSDSVAISRADSLCSEIYDFLDELDAKSVTVRKSRNLVSKSGGSGSRRGSDGDGEFEGGGVDRGGGNLGVTSRSRVGERSCHSESKRLGRTDDGLLRCSDKSERMPQRRPRSSAAGIANSCARKSTSLKDESSKLLEGLNSSPSEHSITGRGRRSTSVANATKPHGPKSSPLSLPSDNIKLESTDSSSPQRSTSYRGRSRSITSRLFDRNDSDMNSSLTSIHDKVKENLSLRRLPRRRSSSRNSSPSGHSITSRGRSIRSTSVANATKPHGPSRSRRSTSVANATKPPSPQRPTSHRGRSRSITSRLFDRNDSDMNSSLTSIHDKVKENLSRRRLPRRRSSSREASAATQSINNSSKSTKSSTSRTKSFTTFSNSEDHSLNCDSSTVFTMRFFQDSSVAERGRTNDKAKGRGRGGRRSRSRSSSLSQCAVRVLSRSDAGRSPSLSRIHDKFRRRNNQSWLSKEEHGDSKTGVKYDVPFDPITGHCNYHPEVCMAVYVEGEEATAADVVMGRWKLVQKKCPKCIYKY